MTSIIERLSYIPCLPTVKAGASGRHVVDYATVSAITNVFVRDLLIFPEGRHGVFTREELTKAVCAEVQPFDDYCNDQVESDYIDASLNGLVGSEFLSEDSNGMISCPYLSRMVIDVWKNQRSKLIDESEDETSEDAEEIPELF